MKLTRLRLSNFQSFGQVPTVIALDAMCFLLGPNGTGKTAVLQALARLFGMVPLAVQILRSSQVARNAVRQTYSHVFLDEFQDCTLERYQLIQAAFLGTDIRLTHRRRSRSSTPGRRRSNERR